MNNGDTPETSKTQQNIQQPDKSDGTDGSQRKDEEKSQSQSSNENREKKERSISEIVVFTLSLLITLFLIGYSLCRAISSRQETPMFNVEAQFDKLEPRNGYGVLPVQMTNISGPTMEDITLAVDITGEGGTRETGRVKFDYLPAGAKKTAYFVSDRQLSPDNVKVRVESFKVPESRFISTEKR